MDNFDLKKFLKESKAIENLNPAFKALNENESREERADVDKYEYEKGKKAGKREAMKKKIKEMIVAELDSAGNLSIDTAPGVDAYQSFYEGDPEEDREKDEAYIEGGFGSFEEAKKKKDEDVENVEDVEITDTTEEIPAEDIPTDEAPAAVDGGLEDIAADMKGTEADLMDNLMKAFQIAKGMGNEKLETQVGNTLKFFVSEYIGGGEG
jgi:hypothetical protein